MSTTLVLVSDHPFDQVFAQEAARVAGLEFEKCGISPEILQDGQRSLKDILEKTENPILVFDIGNAKELKEIEKVIQDVIGLYSDRINSNRIHILSDSDLTAAPYLLQSVLLGNLLIKKYTSEASALEAGKTYGHIIKSCLKEKAIGIQALMKPNGKMQEIPLKTSSQKSPAVEAVRKFLISSRFTSRMAIVIATAVDELLLNAIFDAPTDQTGKQIYTSTPRSTVIDLDSSGGISVVLGLNDEQFIVTVVDHFGSLDKKRLFEHLSRSYVDDEYKIKSGVANAGIGLATICRMGGSLFFACDTGSRTEVSVFFKKTKNFRDFKNQFRFISTQFYY